MSTIDTLLQKINPNKKTISRTELIEFVREAMSQIGEINEAYKKYFEVAGSDESPAIFDEIEAKVKKIATAYGDLYAKDPLTAKSKISELTEQIEKIEEYHSLLLEGDDSIQSDIESAQEKITEFYTYLFGDDEDKEGVETEVRQAIADILKSKKDITAFEDHVKNELKPFLSETKDDIETKRKEVDALLSDATVGTLAEGYAESKSEYSFPKALPIKPWKGNFIWNICALLYNTVGRKINFIISYLFFVLPLSGVVWIFANETTAQMVLKSLSGEGVRPTATELIYVKTIISIPLVWIAWYAQRNISQRKRLFEEYNHKLRVVQMYIMFATKKDSYPLTALSALELELIEVIKRNPSEVFGRDETPLDKFAGLFHKGADTAADVSEKAAEVVKKAVSIK